MPDVFIRPNNTVKDELVKTELPHPVRMLSAFLTNPLGISFAEQAPDEKILLFLRRHFITNFLWILITFVLLFVPILILIFKSDFQNLIAINLSIRFILIFIIFYYFAVFTYAFINFLSWFYNVFIVTQKRIVDIDYSSIVIHNVAFTKLSHVQDVNYNQIGFIRSLFNYGDVFAQTAGTEPNFDAHSVPQPRRAAHIIADLIGKEAHKA